MSNANAINRASFLHRLYEMEKTIPDCPDPVVDTYKFGYKDALCDVMKQLRKLPVMNAETIIRCKDCKHGSLLYHDGKPAFLCRWNVYPRNPNHYCALGEGREAE